MRLRVGGVAHIAETIEDDLRGREASLYKSHISSLSDLAASVLSCRSANTAEWMSVLPRKTGEEKSKERYISRILSNRLIKPMAVMNGFVPEIMEMAGGGMARQLYSCWIKVKSQMALSVS